MNTYQSSETRLTKDCIFQALMFLMERKAFDKITITEITKKPAFLEWPIIGIFQVRKLFLKITLKICLLIIKEVLSTIETISSMPLVCFFLF